MKRGLVVLFGILLGVGMVHSVFAEEASDDLKAKLMNGREGVYRDTIIKIDLPPMPLKVKERGREIKVGETPMMEKVVDKETFAKMKKAEEKRTHFTESQKRQSTPPAERLRGMVVRGSSLKREYVPPVVEKKKGALSIDSLR